MPEEVEKDKVILAPNRPWFWKKILGALAILLVYNSFHSLTVYMGLTDTYECFHRYYKMTREPNSLEKFWGEKALESWKFPWVNHKDLAVALVKGKTLIGLSKKKLMEKMAAPQMSKLESISWQYSLPTSYKEYVCILQIYFDENDVAVDSYIDPTD